MPNADRRHMVESWINLPAFKLLSENNRVALLRHSCKASFHRSDYLWKAQEHASFCAYILDGVIEIVAADKNGKKRMINLFGSGDIIGLPAAMKRCGYPASSHVASKSCSVIKLNITELETSIDEHERLNLLQWQNAMIFRHEQVLQEKISILSAGRLEDRLIAMFRHLGERFPCTTHQAEDSIFIPLPLSKTQIAKVIEARGETVTRMLNKWEKTGNLEMRNDGVILRNIQL